jgi:uncharacterized protein (TIGR03382 family)
MWTVLVRAVLPAVLAWTPAAPVPAAAAARAPARPDFSLTVSPSRVIVPADQAGFSRQFTVTNHGRSPTDVAVRLASFTAGGDGGLVFRSDAPHSAAGWVTVAPDRFRLAAGSAERVSLRIDVPATADPGEHEVAVIFSVPPPAGGTDIGVSRSVGAPVYVTVPGSAVDSVEVTGLRAPGFALRGPVALTARVRNAGTVHRDFVGDDRLRVRVAGDTLPFPDFTLLRGGSREVGASWTDPPLFCVCRAVVTVVDPDGASRSARTTIVILPVHLIGPGAAIVLALLLLGWLFRRRARRHFQPVQ